MDKCVPSTEEKCNNVESVQNVTDNGNISAIYIETSDASKREMENEFQLVTDLSSSIDRGKEFTYCASATKIYNIGKNILEKSSESVKRDTEISNFQIFFAVLM